MAILETRNIVKVYRKGTCANNDVSFSVDQGEIHAIVGEKGAGNTRLMRILYGMELPTSGQIFLRGQPVSIDNPHKAIELGIGMVHQNFMLVDSFRVAQNIALGREPTSGMVVDRNKAIKDTRALSEVYGLNVDPLARVEL